MPQNSATCSEVIIRIKPYREDGAQVMVPNNESRGGSSVFYVLHAFDSGLGLAEHSCFVYTAPHLPRSPWIPDPDGSWCMYAKRCLIVIHNASSGRNLDTKQRPHRKPAVVLWLASSAWHLDSVFLTHAPNAKYDILLTRGSPFQLHRPPAFLPLHPSTVVTAETLSPVSVRASESVPGFGAALTRVRENRLIYLGT